MAARTTLASTNARIDRLVGLVERLVGAEAAPRRGRAAAAVTVTRRTTPAQAARKAKAEKFHAEKIATRLLCAYLGEKCIDKDGKPATFGPNSVGTYSHTTCKDGREMMAALAAGEITREELMAK